MMVRESSKWLRSVGTNHKPWDPWSSASLCILCDALFLQHIAFLFFDLLEWFLFIQEPQLRNSIIGKFGRM